MKKIIFTVALITGIISIGFGQNQIHESNGNIGIGIINPKAKLHIFDNSNLTEIFLGENASSNKSGIIKYIQGNNAQIGRLQLGNWGDNLQTHGFNIIKGGNVGIGTATPSSGLEIFRGSTNNLALLLKSSGAGWGSGLQFENTNGNKYGIYSGADGKWHFSHEGYGDRLVINSAGNIGVGTAVPGSWKLAVNGQIRAKEIKVETGWSDFVFFNDYELPSLKEVEKHIKEKGHLKDIPSAKEVEKNGILLGEMNSKLLLKIEELTLYTIQQQKEIEKQNSKLETQVKEISELKSLVKNLLESKK